MHKDWPISLCHMKLCFYFFSVLVVLKKLYLNLGIYLASEIDMDAINVSYYNHGDDVTRLCDIELLTENDIKERVPINLLIGGSPCNELSLVNRKRRGLHRT